VNLFDEADGRLSGLEQLRSFISAGRRAGIAVSLDFALVEVEPGRAVFAGKPGPHAANPIGSIHGGYAAAMLDSACGCAVHSQLTAQQGYTTLDLKVAYHKAILLETGELRAEGRVISIGRRAAFAEGTVRDSHGKLYASASSTLLVFDR